MLKVLIQDVVRDSDTEKIIHTLHINLPRLSPPWEGGLFQRPTSSSFPHVTSITKVSHAREFDKHLPNCNINRYQSDSLLGIQENGIAGFLHYDKTANHPDVESIGDYLRQVSLALYGVEL